MCVCVCVCDGKRISYYLWRAEGFADPPLRVPSCLCSSARIPAKSIRVSHLGDIITCKSLTPEAQSNNDDEASAANSASAIRVITQVTTQSECHGSWTTLFVCICACVCVHMCELMLACLQERRYWHLWWINSFCSIWFSGILSTTPRAAAS